MFFVFWTILHLSVVHVYCHMIFLFSYVIKYNYFIYLLYAERQGNESYCMIFKVILLFSFEEKSNTKLFIFHTLCMKVIKKNGFGFYCTYQKYYFVLHVCRKIVPRILYVFTWLLNLILWTSKCKLF